MSEEMNGVVLRFDESTGYGFIEPDDGGDDVFVHANDLNPSDRHRIRAGLAVSFDIVSGDRGDRAVNIVFTDAAGLTTEDLDRQLTEALIEAAPSMTLDQLAAVRRVVASIAANNGWAV